MRKVCLLGATGSIGTQSLEVISEDLASFSLVAFSAGHQIGKVDGILRRFPSVRHVCLMDTEENRAYAEEAKTRYPDVAWHFGDEGLIELIDQSGADMIENALVGFVGCRPSLYALSKGKILCLANKESLVVAGELMKKALKEGGGTLYPIDSEHVAIAKCLSKVRRENVDYLLLTGSGGAFRNLSRDELKNVTPEMALRHPTWSMGPKITIDSATMMNKGFEVIEAHYLFDWPIDDIKVILHDESEVHSLIRLKDGRYLADVGKPSMKGPIAYALYEGKVPFEVQEGASLGSFGPYHFHEFDPKRYPAVGIAVSAFKKGGVMPTVLNAADEEADRLFLEGKIRFLDIERLCVLALSEANNIMEPTLDDIIGADREARAAVRSLAEKGRRDS
jgi:1-deoxy-D-xylulose-5-phosphate reductoisomerase